MHLNLPSVNAPVLPGRLTTVRTANNVTNRLQTYKVTTTRSGRQQDHGVAERAGAGAGRSANITITVTSSTAPTAQYFGEVKLPRAAPACPRCTCRWPSCRSRAA